MTDWATEIAAQLWGKPEFSEKQMDVEFAKSIASALRKARHDGILMAKAELMNVNGNKATLWNVNCALNALAFESMRLS